MLWDEAGSMRFEAGSVERFEAVAVANDRDEAVLVLLEEASAVLLEEACVAPFGAEVDVLFEAVVVELVGDV